MDPDLTQKIEAILFASGRFMDEEKIAELAEATKTKVKNALKLLQETYANSGSALQVIEEDGAWKLHVRDEFLELVSKVVSDTELSGPVLETLAYIAWQSPVLQSKVVEKRGANAYEHIKEIVERGFIIKEPEGRSYRLRVTEKFFEYFDIEGREDIRKIFKEVEEKHRKAQVENELAKKRLEKALKKAETGTVAIIDMQPPIKENNKQASGKVSIEDLDEVLEKSKAAREELDKILDETKTKEEKEEEIDFEKAKTKEEKEEEIDFEKAKQIREQVEQSIEQISGIKKES